MTDLFDIQYDSTSHLAKTQIFGRFLGYYEHRRIDPHPLDRLIRISDPRYIQRPDNLAFDIYGNDNYWWVIPVRNSLEDPIFSLRRGIILVAPDPTYIRTLV